MKKYNKPEIVAIALETVDVIATSLTTTTTVAEEFNRAGINATVQSVAGDINTLSTDWQW